MYEKYFVVDGHMHDGNAAPDNWVPGAEQFAKGWIECFRAHMGLGPSVTAPRAASSAPLTGMTLQD